MENVYRNLSNSSDSTNEATLGPGFTAFIIIAAPVLGVIFTFDGLVAIMLLLSTALPIPIRSLLINLLVANLVSVVILFCSTLNSIALSLSDTTQPSLPFCRFIIWGYSVTLEARLLGLMAVSVTVLRIVTSGLEKPGVKWLVLCLTLPWVIGIITCIDSIIPPIYGVQYVGGVACFPAKGDSQYEILSLTYFALWIVIGCFLPLLVCFCIPLVTMCYIKRHTITEGAQYKKAIAKFAAFLITGNVVNFLGQVVPAIIALLISDIVGVYLAYTMYALSLIPTPILIIVYLKPVRKHMAHILCKKCLKDIDATPAQEMNIQIGQS